MEQAFIIANSDGSSRTVELKGRNAWTLAKLIEAGNQGCTAMTEPAPRWSGYIHKLRHRYGLQIETIRERHGGQFAGTHARYFLKSPVRLAPGQRDRVAA